MKCERAINLGDVLVAQARLPGPAQREQTILTPIIRQAGRRPYYVDALTTNVGELLAVHSPKIVIFPGTADASLAEMDENARAYLNNIEQAIAAILSGRGTRAFGICFGHQAIARVAGGIIKTNEEVGTYVVTLTEEGRRDPVFHNVTDDPSGQIRMVFGHHDGLGRLPRGATLLGTTERDPWSVLSYGEGRILTFQGHPELDGEQARKTAEAGGYKGDFSDSDRTEQIIVNFLRE